MLTYQDIHWIKAAIRLAQETIKQEVVKQPLKSLAAEAQTLEYNIILGKLSDIEIEVMRNDLPFPSKID